MEKANNNMYNAGKAHKQNLHQNELFLTSGQRSFEIDTFS